MTELELPVIGYRYWRCGPDGLLGAWARDAYWQPGENIACCVRKPPLTGGTQFTYPPSQCAASPNPDCYCGLHAHHHVLALARPWMRQPFHRILRGVVLLYGSVLIGTEEHIRAEKAEILALVADGDDPAVKRYGVTAVENLSMLRAVALEHGIESSKLIALERDLWLI